MMLQTGLGSLLWGETARSRGLREEKRSYLGAPGWVVSHLSPFLIPFNSADCGKKSQGHSYLTLGLISASPPLMDLAQKCFSFFTHVFIINGGTFLAGGIKMLLLSCPLTFSLSSVWSIAFFIVCQGCKDV